MIELNTTYTHSGNALSRAFLVAGLPAGKKCLVFDNQADLRIFAKTLAFVTGQEATLISDTASLLHFLSSQDGYFLTTREIFTLRANIDYLEKKYTLPLSRKSELSIEDLIKTLIDFGYTHSPHLSKPGSYKKDGDTISIRSAFASDVYSLSFFDTALDEILLFDTVGNYRAKHDAYTLVSLTDNTPFESLQEGKTPEIPVLCPYLADTVTVCIDLDFFDGLDQVARHCPNCIVFSGNPLGKHTDLGIREPKIETLSDLETIVREHGKTVHFYTKHAKALRNFLEYNALTSGSIRETTMTGLESFVSKQSEYHITDDVLSRIFIRNRTKKSIAKNLDLLLEIRPNDYIVHRDHGVGIFREIVEKDLGGNKREYMAIEYAANDRLFVPLAEIHRVSKYIGDEHPKLTRLSTTEWKKVLEKTTEDVERIAQELLDIYAHRSLARGFSFRAHPREERAFRDDFKYRHTPDQTTAILEIFADMESDEPMERLLSGDVGFGKTEVAMNAIYKATLSGKQSAFISPLVVLAYEHYESLQERFRESGVRLAVMTRLTSTKEVRTILQGLRDGTIDCVVGTHRLLGEDIVFKNLGLLVIDEEHRFWVLDKEKINAIKSNIDILSLSATPIPRSLNLALSGVKKISVLTTPPPLKKAINTLVVKWDEDIIKSAIEKELSRGGQVIFLHNRVASIESTRARLTHLLGKKIRIAITHGKMNGIELEDRIIDFKNGKYDILLSTTVIENGVNFLNANTIFIDDAERFGLAQLHQLRGRVGRKDQEAFCYLVYHSDHLDDDAKRRLLTIVNHSELGAGFEIALRDLEIRGAGDILGIKQSGKTSDTGLSLYLKLLEEKVEELRSGKTLTKSDCKIELDLSYFIDNDFFDSELDKIRFFRDIESIETLDDLAYTQETFADANETLPESFENLFLLLRARMVLRTFGVTALKKIGSSYVFELDPATEVPTVRAFLELDRTGDFVLISVHKIKVDVKVFRGDRDFLEKLLPSPPTPLPKERGEK